MGRGGVDQLLFGRGKRRSAEPAPERVTSVISFADFNLLWHLERACVKDEDGATPAWVVSFSIDSGGGAVNAGEVSRRLRALAKHGWVEVVRPAKGPLRFRLSEAGERELNRA